MKGRETIDYNVIIDGLCALVVIIILVIGRRLDGEGQPQRRMIFALMIGCAVVFAVDIPGLLLDGKTFPGARQLLWFFDTAYWMLHAPYCLMWVVFTDLWCFGSIEDTKRRAWFYAIPMVVKIAVILTNPLTGWLFILDERNVYTPGTRYNLCLIPYYLYLLCAFSLAIIGCCVNRDRERRRKCQFMIVYIFLPFCGSIMELLAYDISWVWPTVALSLLMVYLDEQRQILLDEQLAVAQAAETAARMDAQMASSRMAIMLSQIQPHFLYNALCVIQDLCHGKAPEAEQATIAFSRFLRGNLDSLRADKPIAFEQEINHTKYYLQLEAMRFGERLAVRYDIGTTSFCLPALTLQPVVENAVRYGVTKREQGGTVLISTRETRDAFLVAVKDDGVGFNPYQKHEDGRTHIGISNVRQRLRDMCAGDLVITSEQGVGTLAVITIPKGVKSVENTGG
ncbi:MAG: histidine kinase [Clostridia bacterium]|nr:histidine kinase [Clostridia bacterium]